MCIQIAKGMEYSAPQRELLTAGPSSSMECFRDSGPRTSNSTVDSSRSEPEDFQEPGQELDVRVVSLLSRLA